MIGTMYNKSTNVDLVEFNTHGVVRAHVPNDRKDKSDNFMTIRHFCTRFPCLQPFCINDVNTDSGFRIYASTCEKGSAILAASLMAPVNLSRQVQSMGYVISIHEEIMLHGNSMTTMKKMLDKQARDEKREEKAEMKRKSEDVRRKQAAAVAAKQPVAPPLQPSVPGAPIPASAKQPPPKPSINKVMTWLSTIASSKAAASVVRPVAVHSAAAAVVHPVAVTHPAPMGAAASTKPVGPGGKPRTSLARRMGKKVGVGITTPLPIPWDPTKKFSENCMALPPREAPPSMYPVYLAEQEAIRLYAQRQPKGWKLSFLQTLSLLLLGFCARELWNYSHAPSKLASVS